MISRPGVSRSFHADCFLLSGDDGNDSCDCPRSRKSSSALGVLKLTDEAQTRCLNPSSSVAGADPQLEAG
jgi:hypothetical protein